SEVKLQSKLHIARVAGASKASEVAGADRQGRVAQAAQRIVRAVEDIEEVGLERQAHILSRQFEVFAQRKIRHENVGAGKGAHAVRSRACGGRVSEGSGIEPLTCYRRGKRNASNSIRAPPTYGCIAERGSRQDR